MPRRMVAFRVSERSHLQLRSLAEDLGISQAAVVELGLVLLARLTRRDLVKLAARLEMEGRETKPPA